MSDHSEAGGLIVQRRQESSSSVRRFPQRVAGAYNKSRFHSVSCFHVTKLHPMFDRGARTEPFGVMM
jgi:hypothetical protein